MTAFSSSCPSTSRLRQMLAGELSSAETEALATHLEGCGNCQQTAEQIEAAEPPQERFEIEEDALPYAEESQCGRLVEHLAARSPAGEGISHGGAAVQAPERLGDYELIERVGEGGMGTVYRACHRTTGTLAAVKILHPQRRLDQATIERFEREMVALGRLDHPNIVRALDAGHDDGQHYLVMEYVDGTDLGQVLQARGPLPIADAAEAARQAALGLAYVHNNGRVHRDVKPSNLMVSSDGTVKLLDLGLARVEEFPVDEPLGGTDDILGGSTLELTRTHQVMGTLDYMAPEQASDSRSVDHRADIYALGCTLYKLLTGHSPFASTRSISALSQVLAHVETPAPPVRQDRADVPEGLAELLDRMLAKKPDERPQTAAEVAAALTAFTPGANLSALVTEGGPTDAAGSTNAGAPTVIGDSGARHDLSRTDADIPAPRPRRRRGMLLACAAGLLLLLVGAALWSAFWSPLAGVPEATLLVEAATPEASAELARSRVTISGGNHTQPITEGPNEIPAGRYLVSFDTDSRLQFSQRDFHLEPDEQLVLAVSLAPVRAVEPVEPDVDQRRDASPPAIRTVELIPLIDQQRDVRGDDWRVEGNALVSHEGQPSMLLIPYRPPDEYRVELTATRLKWAESLQLGLVAGESPLILAVDSHPGSGFLTGPYQLNRQGLLNRSEHVHRGQVLPVGRPVALSATVRRTGNRASVDLLADGRSLTSWRGPISDGSGTGSFPPPELGVLFLGNWTASIRVENLRVTPLSGDGEVIRFTDPQQDRLRAAMERAVWKGGTLTVQADGVVRTIEQVADVQQLPATASSSESDLSAFLETMTDSGTGRSEVRLTGIDLSQSRWLNDDDLAYFANLRDLQTLNLEGTSITEAGLARLGRLPALASLRLGGTGVRALPDSLLGQMPSLRVLDLHQTPVQTLPVELLEQLSSLEALNLSATPVRKSVSRLTSLGNLRELDLSQTSLSSEELAALPAAAQLTRLNLAGTRVNSLEPVTVERFPALAHLNVLDTEVVREQVDRCAEEFSSARPATVADSPPTAVAGPVDLIELIDVERDADRQWNPDHRWSKQEGRLVSNAMSRVSIPIEFPHEFDVTMTATRHEEGEAPILAFVLPDGTRFAIGLDYSPGDDDRKFTLLHGVAGRKYLKSPAQTEMETFPVGEPVSVTVKARGTDEDLSIRVFKGRDEVLRWDGNRSQLTPYDHWWLGPRSDRSWMSQWNGSLSISELTLTPINGEVPLSVAGSAVVAVPAGESIDVLPLIDLSRDAADWEATWLQDGGGVFHTQPKSRTVLPIELPMEFDLEMTAVALQPLNSTIFGLALPDGTHFSVGFDHTPEKQKQAILHWIDGKFQEESSVRRPLETFAVGQPATIQISVRGQGEEIAITASKDDEVILEWKGDRSRLDVTNPWWLGPNSKRPWISQFDGVLEIREVTVTPVSGEATLPSVASGFEIVSSYGPIDLIPMIDTERDAGQGRWTKQSGVLQAPSHTRVLLPIYLPPEFEIEMLVRKTKWDNNGGNAPLLQLPLPDGTRVMVGFDHWPEEGGYTIIHGIDGKMEKESPAKEPGMVLSKNSAQPTRLMVRVEGTGTQVRVSAHVDGTEVVAWAGERSRMRPEFYGNPHDPQRPTIAQNGGATEISKLTLTPLSGRVELPSFGPSYADPDRDVAEWVLAHGGTFKIPLVEGQPWNMQEYRPGDELPAQAFWVGEIQNLQGQALPAEWLAKVGELNGLMRLNLSGSDFANSDLAPLAEIEALEDVSFNESALNDEGLSYLARLPKLKVLAIRETAVTSPGLQVLENHPTIVRLNVAGLPVDDTVCAVAATMPLLEDLHISWTEVTGDGLQRLGEIPNLRLLGLHDCPRLKESDLKHLARLPRLEWLGTLQNGWGPSAMEPLGRITSLTFLDVWRNPIGDEGIEHLSELRNLTELRVGATGLTDDAIETISSLTRLEVLALEGNPAITDRSVEPLTRLRQLRELHLDGTSITPQGIARIQAGLPNCLVHAAAVDRGGDTLDLRGSDIGDEELAAALEGKYPKALILEGPGITDRSIPLILSRPELSRLSCDRTRITESAVGQLAALPNLQRIEFLNMPQISGDVTEHLVRFPSLRHVVFKHSGVYGPGLQRLHGTKIDSINIGHQALNGEMLEKYIVPFEQLTVLDLAGARIHDEDVGLLNQMTITHTLHLGYNAHIQGPGLSHIKDMPQLVSLNLDASGVDDAGLKHLAGANQLERLILRKTAVSDDSVDLIASLSGLTEVHLNETKFTPTGIARLRLARPDCRVLSDVGENEGVSGTLELTDSDVDNQGLAVQLAQLAPRKLVLRGSGFTDEAITAIRKQSGLIGLALFNTSISEQGIGQLTDLKALEEIEFWNMPQITGEVTRHLAQLPNLQVVIFKGTGIAGPGLERLHEHELRKVALGNGSIDHEVLEKFILPFGPTPDVDLAGTGIRDEDIALLKSMEPKWLHLGFNANITGPGLESLLEMPSLTILLLDSASLDDAGLSYLAGATNLERLYLRDVPITDAAVETLTTLRNLKVLNITGTQITEEGIARIREAMPRLQLWTDGLQGVDATYPPRHAERIMELGMRPSFSADGTQLVYGLPQGEGLRILDLESGAVRALPGTGKDAKWSPNGEWIAFIKEQQHNSGDGVLALVRPDGSDLQTFEQAHYPFWLAGGEQLAYYSRPTGSLLTRDLARPEATVSFHEQTPSYFCDATSDGRYLAFGDKGVVQVVDRQTGETVFSRRFEDSTGTGLPAFSPDGRYLAYNAWGTPENGIWLFDWQSGSEVELCPGNYAAPAWSPDGRRLAFDSNTEGARHEVWMIDLTDRLPSSQSK